VVEEEIDSSHGPGSAVGAFSLSIKQGLIMWQGGSVPADQDGAALLKNFMRNLWESTLSEAASTNSPQGLGVKEGTGVQVELDGPNR